jgi:1-acyl-sn-glycerol-3-phosphate acyltransferase
VTTPSEGPAAREPRANEGAAPFDRSVTPLVRACALGGRLFTRAVTRLRVEGDLSAIPREGPLIIASNHASNLDPVVLGSWLVPAVDRRIHWLGKKELFDWPVVGWLARNGGVHPVDRSGSDVEAFRLAKRILDEGHILLVFPEGTRSPTGELQEARDGVALLALRTGAPILPIGIAGSDRVWPRGRKLPKPGGRVVMRIGSPLRLDEAIPPGTDRRAAKALATTLLMGRIAALLPPAQRGPYGDRAADPPEEPAPPER